MDLTPRFREEHLGIATAFLRHHLADSGRKGFLVGMSGGLDSSVVAALCAAAAGPRRVLGVSLPVTATGAAFRDDARGWARRLRVAFREIPIDAFIAPFTAGLAGGRDRLLAGNVQARVRMILLYHLAGREGRLVIGTGNKSELLTGYFTKFGDGGCDFLPLGDLFKTQVRAMAVRLGVPRRILDKPPTAGLWPGQTDEGELGLGYDDLDRVLHGIELHLEPRAIAERAGVSRRTVDRVERLVVASVHKRKMPLVPKMGSRTVGLDWRE